MLRLVKLFTVSAVVAVIAAYALFGQLPSFLRKTRAVFLKPEFAFGVKEGTRVYKYGVDIGYVGNVTRVIDSGVTIELRIFNAFHLYQSDVCVIHRLHRYDRATFHIESTVGTRSDEPLGDPPILSCLVANGAWPDLPGLSSQSEN